MTLIDKIWFLFVRFLIFVHMLIVLACCIIIALKPFSLDFLDVYVIIVEDMEESGTFLILALSCLILTLLDFKHQCEMYKEIYYFGRY